MPFQTLPVLILSSVCLLGGVNEPASAQRWTVALEDVFVEDPDTILDRTCAESVEFLPGGKTLVTAGHFYNGAAKMGFGEVRLRGAEDGSITATIYGNAVSYAHRAGSLAVSPSGDLIAATGRDHNNQYSVDVFDSKARSLVRTLTINPSAVTCVAFSPDSSVLAVAHLNGSVELWDPGSGKIVSSFVVRNAQIWPVSFSPDGKVLAIGTAGGSISFWDPMTTDRIAQIDTPGIRLPGCVVFSPDGKLIACGGLPSQQGTSPILVWEVSVENDDHDRVTVKQKAAFEGHRDHTYSLAFSPDGHLLASANQDTTVKIWDVVLKKEVATISDHNDFVYDVAFAPMENPWQRLAVTLSNYGTRHSLGEQTSGPIV